MITFTDAQLELTVTERDRLNREFFWTIRGVRR